LISWVFEVPVAIVIRAESLGLGILRIIVKKSLYDDGSISISSPPLDLKLKINYKSKENKKNRKDAGNERQTIKTEEHHRHVRQVFFVLHLHICQHMRTHFRKSMAVFLEKVVAAK